jgi:DNA-binding CsgD family transcriptional regulator
MNYKNKIKSRLIAKGVTSKQLEVIFLLMEGLSTREIGLRLFVTDKAVKYHISSLCALFKVKSRVGIMATCHKLLMEIAELEVSEPHENFLTLVKEKICGPIIAKEELVILPSGIKKIVLPI